MPPVLAVWTCCSGSEADREERLASYTPSPLDTNTLTHTHTLSSIQAQPCWSRSIVSPCRWAWRSTASLSSTWSRWVLLHRNTQTYTRGAQVNAQVQVCVLGQRGGRGEEFKVSSCWAAPEPEHWFNVWKNRVVLQTRWCSICLKIMFHFIHFLSANT